MTMLMLVVVLAMMAGVGAWMYWRKKNKSQLPFISLVVLLREPMTLDAAVLATLAGNAWNADLGHGVGEGDDGFVVSVGDIGTIMHQGRPYLVNCIPAPYFDDPQEVAEAIRDLRIQALVREHRAWFSCDALFVENAAPAEVTTQCYQLMARLVAAVLDENCLLMYVPQSGQAYPINDETRRALQSDDPLTALRAAAPLPVIALPPDDEEMEAAELEARQTWPRFVAAFEQRAGEEFSVKAPITYEDTTEFIWITVTAVEGDRIYGLLGNDPANLGPLVLGSKVSVSIAELNDWCYVDPQGNLQGGFTVSVVMKAANRN